MRKQTQTPYVRRGARPIPDEIDLSAFQSLSIAFTDGRGKEVLNIQFRHEAGGSPELAINILDQAGEVASALTLFDLEL